MKTNVSGQGACSKQIELENIKIKAPCSSSFFFFVALISVYFFPSICIAFSSRFISYD
jgi:hypothetical protein